MYNKLKKFGFLKGVSKETIDKINKMDITFTEYNSNELVYQQGDVIDNFNFIISGGLKTNEYLIDGKEIVSSYYFENDAFPFYLIYGGTTHYPYNVYSYKKTVVAHLPVNELVECINNDFQLMKNILKFVSEYTCYNKFIIRLLQYNRINQRLAYWLLNLHEDMDYAEIPGSQEVLSDILGVNRPSLNQELRKLKDAKIISVKNKKIIIIDRKYLEDLLNNY